MKALNIKVFIFLVISLLLLSVPFIEQKDKDTEDNFSASFDNVAVYYGKRAFGNEICMCKSYDLDNVESGKDTDNDKWYLFLPYSTDTVGSYKCKLPKGTNLEIDGHIYRSDSEIPISLQDAKVRLLDRRKNVLCEGLLSVSVADGLNSVFLTTSYEDSEAVFTDRYALINAVMITTDTRGQQDKMIHCITGGRGGSTWASCPKRPLRINLSDDIGLFGMSPSSKYALIANYMDPSNLKDAIVYKAADMIGMKYSPQFRHVNLYVNGEYAGLYLFSTRINTRGGSVDFEHNLDEANKIANSVLLTDVPKSEILDEKTRYEIKYSILDKDPEDITGSYLMEFDLEGRPQEEQYVNSWFNTENKTVVINSPQYASKEETFYIADYVRQVEKAVYSEDGINHDTGLSYKDYLDVESWSTMCLMQDFFALQDYSDGSLFMYKLAGDDKIYGGPIWDYDKSMTDDFYSDKRFAYNDSIELGGWYGQLSKFTDVSETSKAVYRDKLSPALEDIIDDYLPKEMSAIALSMKMDDIRWARDEGDEEDRAREVYTWLMNRKLFFDNVLSK